MSQVTLYLDDGTAKKMNQAAKKAGLSKSQWVASLIRNKISHEWPATVIRLAGAWQDLPLSEEIRASMGHDARREPL